MRLELLKTLIFSAIIFLQTACLTNRDSTEPSKENEQTQASGVNNILLNLGDENRVKALFSYPNNCHVVCYFPESLEETVRHWMTLSLRRDGFDDVVVTLKVDAGNYYLAISARNISADYAKRLDNFFKSGDIALATSRALLGKKQWKADWYYILPIGLPIYAQRSVQLLHFPPDTVLREDRDYLVANTTLRWADVLKANGALSSETDSYQSIVDIAPIAAPASSGDELDGIYDDYDSYTQSLLDLYYSSANNKLPMVSYGGAVRKYVKNSFGVDLAPGVLGKIKLKSGQEVAVMGSNHPSYIWYAYPNEAKFSEAMVAMETDLIVGCWQYRLGKDRNLDPYDLHKECSNAWKARKFDTCVLLQQQAKRLSPSSAEEKCRGKGVKNQRARR